MTDDELAFLIKAHKASGKLLLGETPTPEENAALDHLLTKLAPVVKRMRAEQASSNGHSGTPLFFR